MATRKSSGAPKKPKGKNTTKRGSSASAERRAHNPEAGGSNPPPATKRTSRSTKKPAPVAQPAEQLPRKEEVAGSKPARGPKRASAATTPPAPPESAGITDRLLAKPPVFEPDAPLTADEHLFVKAYMANGLNGTAAYRALHPKANAATAAVEAHRLLRKPKVRALVEAARADLARKFDWDRDRVLAHLSSIVLADANELSQMRRVCCSGCWSGMPENDRPQGWNAEPDPDCVKCDGEGVSTPWFADTRKLSPEARLLYNGVYKTKDGVRILTQDRADALKEIARILGLYEKDNEQKGRAAADVLREFFGALHGGAGRIHPVKAQPRAPGVAAPSMGIAPKA